MTQYTKILITTDGSEKTSPAIMFGLGLAKVMGAEVTAMCVIDDADYGDMMSAAAPEAESVLYQNCAKAAETVVALGRSMGVRVKPVIVGGIPASEIIQASMDHDLTVTGTVGRTGMSHLLLGSVAEKVVRLAHSPVLVVHSGVPVDSRGIIVRKVLIPTDGSENTKPAIMHGLALARAFNAEVTALYVSEPEAASHSKGCSVSERSTTDVCREATELIVEEGKRQGIAVTPLVLAGKPSEEIAKLSVDYDLVVMGTVGRTGLAHIRLGSVAESTVRQVKCPVIVVRAKETKAAK